MTDLKPVTKEEIKITSHQFYFETSLYEPIPIDSLDGDIFNWEVDAYSPANKIDTTFRIQSSLSKTWKSFRDRWGNKATGYEDIVLTCKRKGDEVLKFYLKFEDDSVIKVWQFPSIADIQYAEIWKRYDKVLDKGNLSLLKKAIGLFAHWAWAGSFVYLRRIFEGLMQEVFKENEENIKVKEADFQYLKMEEKIDVLNEYLPALLIKHKAMYGVLSKWVHQLTEEDCLSHFKTIKGAIELILTQRVEEKRKKDEEDRIAKEMGMVYQSVK